MGIRAVVWDIDDTLFDYTGTDRAAALRHFEAEGLLSRFPGPDAAVRRWREVMEVHYARFLAGETDFAGQRRDRARAFLGERLSDAEADAWFRRYRAHWRPADGLFPDVLPALASLTPGYRHGLLSNSDTAHQDLKLRAMGIRDRFEVLLCSDQVGHAKPAPEAFLAVCDAMDLPPRAVAYIGDRPDIDAAAADAAGLHGIWLDRAGASAAAAAAAVAALRRISGLADLPGLLADLARSTR
ncbi:HAD family hydrolase [Streptomyces sp. MP131-18]|uniref:HAD family hydrolase n=1 Tax=Streptomyces sp. MP131-18 TaxID=1857892 RepID=UPI00097CA51F|nr:HAD family hydrolase [Streptomyces sp. MP131-18]ONK10315.1 Pyrimidine 5'-nucleotidase YjjG [Streptomyces sp. MP131-18]